MTKENEEQGGKIKRTVKDKLYFIVFGKYPEPNEEEIEEDEELEEEDKKSKKTAKKKSSKKSKKNDDENDDESGDEEKKETSYFAQAKSFFKKKAKEKTEDVKKNAKKMASKEKDEYSEKKSSKKVKVKNEEPVVEEDKEESAFDSLKGLALEEVSSFKKVSKKREKETKKQEEKSQKEQEKLFKEKTKMTLLQAEKKVKKWNEKGETKKVKAGVQLILEYFPNHVFRKMNLSKNNPKKGKEAEEGITKKLEKKSLFAKVASNPAHGFDVSAEFLEQNGLPQEADVNDDERVFGALSYFPLLSLFVLATRKDSAFAMYHAWQGFAILAIFLVSLPFFWILTFIPGMIILFYLFYIALFFISIYAGFLAWSGRYINIPGISVFAMKLAGK